jgi:hypothetical protein
MSARQSAEAVARNRNARLVTLDRVLLNAELGMRPASVVASS